MELSLRTDPRLVRIASALDRTNVHAMGAVCLSWMLADEHADENGEISGLSADGFDALIQCPGAAQALESVGWLEVLEDGVRFPNYLSHNGSSAKRRAMDQKRKRLSRKCPLSCGQDADRMRTREEERREEESTLPNGSVPAHAPELPLVELETAVEQAQLWKIDRATVEKWHLDREACGWLTAKGLPIRKWDADLRKFATTCDEIAIRQNGGKPPAKRAGARKKRPSKEELCMPNPDPDF